MLNCHLEFSYLLDIDGAVISSKSKVLDTVDVNTAGLDLVRVVETIDKFLGFFGRNL
jgi:hypothetical protein